jgi:hypothetical protein
VIRDGAASAPAVPEIQEIAMSSDATEPVGGTRMPATAAGTHTPAPAGGGAALLSAAQRLLPDSPMPAVLGGSALALAGVIEWPVVAAIGLGYVALRRWHRPA